MQTVAVREAVSSRSAPRRNGDVANDRTIPALFLAGSGIRADQIAMRWKRRGIWEAVNWADYANAVREVGCALIAFGLQRGDRVAILSENRPEWLYVDLGVQSAGGVTLGIEVYESIERIAEIVSGCGARFLFVDSAEQFDAISAGLANTPALERIVCFEARIAATEPHARVVDLAHFRADGRQFDERHLQRWQAAIGEASADDIATVIYGPGSTATRLSHRDLAGVLDTLAQCDPGANGDEQLSILSLGRLQERCFTAYRPLVVGSIVNFVEGPDNLLDGLREVAPHVVMATPAIWKMLHAKIVAAISDASPLGQLGYRLALAAGFARADLTDSGRALPPALRLRLSLAQVLVLNRVKTMIGLQRARVLVCDGAAMPLPLSHWYRALGLTIVDVRDGEDWRPHVANDSLAHKGSR